MIQAGGERKHRRPCSLPPQKQRFRIARGSHTPVHAYTTSAKQQHHCPQDNSSPSQQQIHGNFVRIAVQLLGAPPVLCCGMRSNYTRNGHFKSPCVRASPSAICGVMSAFREQGMNTHNRQLTELRSHCCLHRAHVRGAASDDTCQARLKAKHTSSYALPPLVQHGVDALCVLCNNQEHGCVCLAHVGFCQM